MVETLVGKVALGDLGVDAVKLIAAAGEVQMVVNTPSGSSARSDGAEIRRACVSHGVACVTTMSAGFAAAKGIADTREHWLARPLAPGDASVEAISRRRSPSIALRSPIVMTPHRARPATATSWPGTVTWAELGAVVTKSLAVFPFDEEPQRRRLAASGEHMVNAVGLSGPGVSAWREQSLPALVRHGATVVGSIWGRTVEEFAQAADAMSGAAIVALEVNASCPNLENRREIFAHSPRRAARDASCAPPC